jgi:hypothetical protein
MTGQVAVESTARQKAEGLLERLRTSAGYIDPGSARKVAGEGWRLYIFAGPVADDQRIIEIEYSVLENYSVDELFTTFEKLQWQEVLRKLPSNQERKFDGKQLGMQWNG